MQKFCYKCGALEEEKGPLIEGLCGECFLDENPPIKAPREVELEVCEGCGAYFLRGAPRDVGRDPAGEYIEAAKELVASEIEVLQEGPVGIRYESFEDAEDVDIGFEADYTSSETIGVDVGGQIKSFGPQDKILSDRAHVEVKLIKRTCEVCRKRKSGYYEAMLQVRGEDDLSEERISEIFRAIRKEFLRVHERRRSEFVSKIKRKHGGMDLYTSSKRLAEDLARFLKDKYGGEMGESAELVGQAKDGSERYRVTVIIRLPF